MKTNLTQSRDRAAVMFVRGDYSLEHYHLAKSLMTEGDLNWAAKEMLTTMYHWLADEAGEGYEHEEFRGVGITHIRRALKLNF